jgi:hypothetical protein
MMQGTKVVPVLDWEFSGACPLSELVRGVGVDVLEVVDDESEKENLSRVEIVHQASSHASEPLLPNPATSRGNRISVPCWSAGQLTSKDFRLV